MPQALAVLIGSPLAGRLYDKIGGIPVLVVGLFGYALGIGTLAWVSTSSTSWPILLPPLILAGAGVACTMSPIMGEALRAVKPAMMGAASGVISMTRLVGGAIGVAVTSSILQSNLFAALHP
jgi:MFS family permease